MSEATKRRSDEATKRRRDGGKPRAPSPEPRAPAITVAKVGGLPVGEFLLIAFGEVKVDQPISGRDYTFTRQHGRQAVEWFGRQDRKLAIDYEHQTLGAVGGHPEGLAPAAGWIGALQVRGDGLWAAQVEWTERARQLIAGGEYRYFSPVIFWTDEKYTELAGLGPVALTNDPAMAGLQPLAAAREASSVSREASEDGATRYASRFTLHGTILSMRPISLARYAGSTGRTRSLVAQQQGGVGMDAILELLGLAAEATYDEVAAAITEENLAAVAELLGIAGATLEEVLAAIKNAMTPAAEAAAAARLGPFREAVISAARIAAVREIGAALHLGKTDTVEGLIGVARNKLSNPPGHVSVAEHAKAREQLGELQTQVAKLQERNQRTEFHALIASKEHAGKIPPTQQETYFELFREKRKTFDTVLAGLRPLVSAKTVFRGDKPGPGGQPEQHPYEAKLAEVVAARKCTKLEAIRTVRREQPELFEQYRKDRRVSKREE